MKYLLDSNVVIDILRKNEKIASKAEAETENKNKIFICPIVYYEVIRGFKILNATKKLEIFWKYYSGWGNLPLTDKVMDTAAEIYEQLHKGQQIEDNDIFIAATAIANNCTLVTANDKHFARIKNLKLENWR